MTIKICGAFSNRAEHESFHMKLPFGEPLYLFLHFYNPVTIVLNGQTIITKNDACIIYTPDTHQDYYSLKGGFVNDYVKFTVSDNEYIKEKNLPLNEIFYINNTFGISEKIGFITWALTDVLVDHKAEMEKALDEILNELNHNRVYPPPKSHRDNAMSLRLIDLRNKIKDDPAVWTVDRMSKAFYLTRSHFSILYHKQFGISPRDDLLNFRLSYAKKLLKSTDIDISKIAEMCGYKNCENFIRVFKKQFSITPLQFRKSQNADSQ